MSFLFPVWKTKDPQKRREAVNAIRKITDPKKLEKIILEARIPEARNEAVERLRKQIGTEYRVSPETARKRLLTIDWKNFYHTNWYYGGLVLSLPEEKDRLEIALKAKNADVRTQAVRFIQDTESLMEIVRKSDVPTEVRVKAVEQIKDQETLKEILRNEPDEKIKLAAIKRIDDRSELERIRNEQGFSLLKEAACGRIGHKMKLMRYEPYGNGGTKAWYQCEICHYDKYEPVEWSSADSV